MQVSEGTVGRVFVMRLEHGDRLPDCIEQLAAEKEISLAHVVFVGGIDRGEVVVGPRDSQAMPPSPMVMPVEGARETFGTGLLALDATGRPVLHMHASMGRAGHTLTGCIRPGIVTWLVGEVVVYEILGATAMRKPDPKSGFTLLTIDP